MELYKKSAAELSALLRSKEVTACEILDDTLARIDAVEPKVDAFLSVTADTARAKAKEVDEKIARGETLGVLAGIPVGIKDNILSLIHISEPTRLGMISYAVFCLKKKKKTTNKNEASFL